MRWKCVGSGKPPGQRDGPRRHRRIVFSTRAAHCGAEVMDVVDVRAAPVYTVCGLRCRLRLGLRIVEVPHSRARAGPCSSGLTLSLTLSLSPSLTLTLTLTLTLGLGGAHRPCARSILFFPELAIASPCTPDAPNEAICHAAAHARHGTGSGWHGTGWGWHGVAWQCPLFC